MEECAIGSSNMLGNVFNMDHLLNNVQTRPWSVKGLKGCKSGMAFFAWMYLYLNIMLAVSLTSWFNNFIEQSCEPYP